MIDEEHEMMLMKASGMVIAPLCILTQIIYNERNAYVPGISKASLPTAILYASPESNVSTQYSLRPCIRSGIILSRVIPIESARYAGVALIEYGKPMR